MQEFGSLTDSEKTSVLASMTTGTAYDIVDSRDSQVYKIAKLADGKVWLLGNLRLGATTLIQPLASNNTNLDSSTPFNLPSSTTSWGANETAFTTAMINTDYSDTTVTSYGSGSGKVGVYYNYCAATAGTYCYGSGSGTGNASYDICPAGWRMPTDGSGGEYNYLYWTAYSGKYIDFRNALSMPLSGSYAVNSADEQDSRDAFWSSSYYNSSFMLYTTSGLNSINTGFNGVRRNGLSVRCILK